MYVQRIWYMCLNGIFVTGVYFYRENLPSHFKYKEYCPVVFRKLRERFGINDEDYQVLAFLWILLFKILFAGCFFSVCV